MTLTGNVQVTDAGSALWADRVVTEQRTGDATAEGSVKVSYLQPKGGEAKGGALKGEAGDESVHVLAARAEMKHDSQVVVFHGAAGRPARLWQGASQVEAPVLLFEQKQRRLLARGEGQGAAMAVHTVLMGGGAAAKPETARAGATAPARKANVVRVASRELSYSDEERKAEFSGGVQVESADGSMRGQQAVVYLQGAPVAGAGKAAGGKAGPGAGQNGFMGGSVERLVVTGHIAIDQPGRRATGEQVVYTASDGVFVLTGSAGVRPRIVDDQRGTVTGTSLRFHAGDESVVVSNGESSDAGQRVRTETRVKKQR
jgi:lipopolysaccharide export system protein LptA